MPSKKKSGLQIPDNGLAAFCIEGCCFLLLALSTIHALFCAVVRYKQANNASFNIADLGDIIKRAGECARLRQAVESVIPVARWSEKLET